MVLENLWRKFDRLEGLSEKEIDKLIESARQGADYLRSRGEHLALEKTRADLRVLERMRDGDV